MVSRFKEQGREDTHRTDKRRTLWGCCHHNSCSLCVAQLFLCCAATHTPPQGVDAIRTAIHPTRRQHPSPPPPPQASSAAARFQPATPQTRNTTTRPWVLCLQGSTREAQEANRLSVFCSSPACRNTSRIDLLGPVPSRYTSRSVGALGWKGQAYNQRNC